MENYQPLLVPRHAVDLSNDELSGPVPISHWRETAAYVLLAEPGAGKSKAFEVEAQEYTAALEVQICEGAKLHEGPRGGVAASGTAADVDGSRHAGTT